jgi:hypothetical protein
MRLTSATIYDDDINYSLIPYQNVQLLAILEMEYGTATDINHCQLQKVSRRSLASAMVRTLCVHYDKVYVPNGRVSDSETSFFTVLASNITVICTTVCKLKLQTLFVRYANDCECECIIHSTVQILRISYCID